MNIQIRSRGKVTGYFAREQVCSIEGDDYQTHSIVTLSNGKTFSLEGDVETVKARIQDCKPVELFYY